MVTVPLLGGVKLYQTLAESWSEVHDATGSEPAAVASAVLRVSVNGAAAITFGVPHVPVYTVNCVSKLVPKVLAVILPLVAAVKLYHTLRAFLSLVHECIGSDAAVVAVDVSTVAANG